MYALNIQVSLSLQFPSFDPVLSPGIRVWLQYLFLLKTSGDGEGFSFVDCSGSLATERCVFLYFSSRFFYFQLLAVVSCYVLLYYAKAHISTLSYIAFLS